ncbi:hypothetical protein BSPA14S_K0008 (plasmid) [Borreliella spielmanii A14S]|uniref:Uncharacterized protein n=1 Tax=Borreliella spielmanii A14S TaxID=498742 RepID=C0RBR8_9SPIR|nr:hypothetical protein BSPA14S_K0008 [Borreliella spielmanii A14S]
MYEIEFDPEMVYEALVGLKSESIVKSISLLTMVFSNLP